jgi:hypothetical protein
MGQRVSSRCRLRDLNLRAFSQGPEDEEYRDDRFHDAVACLLVSKISKIERQ